MKYFKMKGHFLNKYFTNSVSFFKKKKCSPLLYFLTSTREAKCLVGS